MVSTSRVLLFSPWTNSVSRNSSMCVAVAVTFSIDTLGMDGLPRWRYFEFTAFIFASKMGVWGRRRYRKMQ